MGLASFLARAAAPDQATPAEEDRLRRRARHRLIGSALLVMAAVLALPWVLDRPPRPLPPDLVLELATPAVRAAGRAPAPPEPLELVEPAAEPARPAAAPREREAASARSEAGARGEARGGSRADARAEPPPRPAGAGGRAEAGRPAAAERASAPETGLRVIVQVGSFTDETVARSARLKVERLGFKTYLQDIDAPGAGRRLRVRVGPFQDRDEALKVQARLEKAGFQPVLLTL